VLYINGARWLKRSGCCSRGAPLEFRNTNMLLKFFLVLLYPSRQLFGQWVKLCRTFSSWLFTVIIPKRIAWPTEASFYTPLKLIRVTQVLVYLLLLFHSVIFEHISVYWNESLCVWGSPALLLAYLLYFEKIKGGLLDHLAVYMCIPLIVARQWLGKHFPAVTNRHETVEELILYLSIMFH
jgi:predicted ferric reductase